MIKESGVFQQPASSAWRPTFLARPCKIVNVHHLYVMSKYSKPRRDEGGGVPGHKIEAKERRCLMCHDTFHSEWSGERICKRCRQTAAWRQG